MPRAALNAPGRSKWRFVSGVVEGDQPERQPYGHGGQRHVDEEHRFPAERLGERATHQHAEHEPGRARTAPDGHGAVALGASGECGVDQERGGEHERSAESLRRAGDE
jgi:hypothetical protein